VQPAKPLPHADAQAVVARYLKGRVSDERLPRLRWRQLCCGGVTRICHAVCGRLDAGSAL